MTIKIKSIIFAILAAIFYAINIPILKVLLKSIGSTIMASFLYLGTAKTSAFYSVNPFIGAF